MTILAAPAPVRIQTPIFLPEQEASQYSGKSWRFSLPYLPPSINDYYSTNPTTGKRYVLADARKLRTMMRETARDAGFRPSTRYTYGATVVLYMPRWDSLDIDNALKPLLDSTFSSRTDQRVRHLIVDKIVSPEYEPRTLVEVWQLPAGDIVDWLTVLLVRARRAAA